MQIPKQPNFVSLTYFNRNLTMEEKKEAVATEEATAGEKDESTKYGFPRRGAFREWTNQMSSSRSRFRFNNGGKKRRRCARGEETTAGEMNELVDLRWFSQSTKQMSKKISSSQLAGKISIMSGERLDLDLISILVFFFLIFVLKLNQIIH